jgi:hypothetical protein
MVGRMAQGHLMTLLPFGRLKLLVSAFFTVVIVSLPPALYVAFGYPPPEEGALPDPSRMVLIGPRADDVLAITYTGTFLAFGWLYLAIWFVTSQRSMAGYLKGLLVVLAILLVPRRDILSLRDEAVRNAWWIAIFWAVFGTAFLLWPRWKVFVARLPVPRGVGAFFSRRGSGNEIDVVLGTSNPWLLAAAQTVPIAIAARTQLYSAAVWLFYLTIFSTVAGAIAGQAAERSRGLWLRGGWSRADLFRHVEHSFWRHNSVVLGVLIALMIGIGSYKALPPSLLAVGLPLLALGTLSSTYLGLMVTRGLRGFETLLAIAVMLTLMTVAMLAAQSSVLAGAPSGDLRLVIGLEVLLAILCVGLRFVARRRWSEIDWMICRPDRALSARHA